MTDTLETRANVDSTESRSELNEIEFRRDAHVLETRPHSSSQVTFQQAVSSLDLRSEQAAQLDQEREATDILELGLGAAFFTDPVGVAGGDLDGTYPAPEVEAFTTPDNTRLAFDDIPDGFLLRRSGATVDGLDPSTVGTGDVVGPAGATDNAIARFDTATGKLIQNSGPTISDAGELAMGASRITGVANPTADQDAATRFYSDRPYLPSVRRSHVESDFTEFGNIAEGVTAVAAGAGASNSGGAGIDKTNHPGIWRFLTGSTAAGRVFAIGSATRGYHVGSGITRVGAIVRTDASLSDAVNEYVIRAGLFSMSLPNVINEGIGFEYQFDQNGGRWQGICHDGAETSEDLGAPAVAASTWYNLEFEVNAAGTSVQFYIDGVAVGSPVTTNIPSGTGFDLFFNAHIMKLAGTTSRSLLIDFYYVYQELSR